VNIAHEFLEQPTPKARADWLNTHAEAAKPLLWALKEEAAQHHHSDPQRALDIAHLAQEAAAFFNAPYLVALAHWITANALVFLERHAEAVQHYTQAAALLRQNGHTRELGRMLVGLVFSLAYLDRYDEALALARVAREILGTEKDSYRLGLLAMNLGVIHEIREDFASALQAYEEAANIFRQTNDAFNLARATLNVGIAYEHLDRYQDAEQAYRHAERIFHEQNASLEVARAALNLGVLYVRTGHLGESIAAFDRARDIYQNLRVPLQVAEVDLYEAQALIVLNLFPEAERLAAQALAVLEAQEQFREAGIAAYVRGQALMGQGNLEQARESLLHSLSVFRQLNLATGRIRVRLSLAEVDFRQGNVAQGLENVLVLEQEAATRGYAVLRLQALLQAGDMMLAQEQWGMAEKLLNLALILGKALGLSLSIWQAHYGLARLWLKQKAEDKAWNHLREAVEIVLRIRRLIPGAPYRAAFLADKLPLFYDAVDVALRLGRVTDALSLLAEAQSGALVDAMAVAPQDPALAERWARLRAQLEELKRAWNWHAHTDFPWDVDDEPSTRKADRADTVYVLEARVNRLWQQLHTLTPLPPAPEPSQTWGKYLPEDVFLLTFVPSREIVWGIGLEASGEVVVRRLGAVQDLRLLLARWRGHISQMQGLSPQELRQREPFFVSVAQHVLSALYRFLLRPFADPLSAHPRLWVIPDRMLQTVPFAALHTGDAYLIQCHAVSLLPGLSFLHRPSRPSPGGQLSLICAYSAGGRLPHVPYEAAAVRSLVPRPVLLLEEEATVEAVRSLLEQAHVIHLATHAAFRYDNPLFSYLQLANGRFTAYDLEGIRLRASLVVLSACETGRAGSLGGDLLGLSQAFLAAGARALIVSQWHLYDPTAAAFMETFYRIPDAISQPESALTTTMRHMLTIDPGLHPYFWAPFTLVRGG